MDSELSQTEQPRRKRRWFQFSLRTLLIVTTLLAVGTGLLSQRIARKRKEWDAVQAILRFGAAVRFDRDTSDANATGPSWLREILGKNFFAEVVAVNVTHVQSEDELLAKIKELPELVRLQLSDCRITDSGLENLEGLIHLQELSVGGTFITDSGMPRLKQLTDLRWLWLDNTKVSDAGLASLEGLTHLQTLNLQGTYVTDVGLVHLRGLMSLKELYLANSDATEEGVKDLQKALPNCKIYR